MNHQNPCLVYPPGHPLHVSAPADVTMTSEDIEEQENSEEMREEAQNTIVIYDSSCEQSDEDEDEDGDGEPNPDEHVQMTEAALNSTVTHTESPEPVNTSDVPSSIVTATEVFEDSEAEAEGDDGGVLVTARELLESSDDEMSSASSATLIEPEPESRSRSRSVSSDDLHYATPRNGRSMSPVLAATLMDLEAEPMSRWASASSDLYNASPRREPAMSPALSATSTFAGLESESESESSSDNSYNATPQMGSSNDPVQSIDGILQLQLPEASIPEGWPSDVPFTSTVAMLLPLPIEVLRSLLPRRGLSFGVSSSSSGIANPDPSQGQGDQSSGVNSGHSRPAPARSPVPAVCEPNYTTNFETSEWWMMHAELSSRYASLAHEMGSDLNGNTEAEDEDELEDEPEPEGGIELDSGEEADVESEFEDEFEFERVEDVREGGPDVESGAEADGESEAESETCVGSEREGWGYDVGGSDRATHGSSGSEDNTCVDSESEDEDGEEGGVPV